MLGISTRPSLAVATQSSRNDVADLLLIHSEVDDRTLRHWKRFRSESPRRSFSRWQQHPRVSCDPVRTRVVPCESNRLPPSRSSIAAAISFQSGESGFSSVRRLTRSLRSPFADILGKDCRFQRGTGGVVWILIGRHFEPPSCELPPYNGSRPLSGPRHLARWP